MPVTIIDEGAGNMVELDPEHLQQGSGSIRLTGSGNIVRIRRPVVFGTVHIDVGHGAVIDFGPECILSTLWIHAPDGASLSVGPRTAFNGAVAFHMLEDQGVTLGTGCLIGDGARFWPSDMHSIVAADTRRRINPPRPIVIGNRVWVAAYALVLKGSVIGDGSVLAAAAVLAGSVPANCIAAGNPARVIKRDVTWDQRLLPMG